METIEAIYENGILRPLRPLQLQEEHQAVRLLVLTEDMEALAAMQLRHVADYQQPRISRQEAERTVRQARQFLDIIRKEVFHGSETES
jgi:predicted DNA-binding antitoxin AbrB/MazE fold protein